MTTFLNLLKESNKGVALLKSAESCRNGLTGSNQFDCDPNRFAEVPGAPFAYWVSDSIRQAFCKFCSFEREGRVVKQGLATADDFRFIRAWWEVKSSMEKWPNFAKGGAYAPYYSDIHLVVNWYNGGAEITNNTNEQGKIKSNIWMLGETIKNYFFRPGITWPRRTQKFGPRILPAGCLFSDKGCATFSNVETNERNLCELGIMLSRPFSIFVEMFLNAGDSTARSFEVGIIQKIPVPSWQNQHKIKALVIENWKKRRFLDSLNEASHAFYLPTILRDDTQELHIKSIDQRLREIQNELDEVVFDLYQMKERDRLTGKNDYSNENVCANMETEEDDDGNECDLAVANDHNQLLSWCVGVVFGRFDWRLATGERTAPAEPDPFDPLPAKSPGMLPDGAAPFHANAGILVDDAGHPHDLPHWVEEVLMKVGMPVPHDLRNWLQREFFAAHLKQYSKSRRKAPIYWPLSTASGSYTLWLYYPSLTNQTLYTCVNDFLEPKLKQVGGELANLRGKGSKRSLSDEKQFEKLQTFELELTELRDTLLKIAPHYHPNQDDGVQITAAPLWPLFRHKPWQKVLKETWAKLEKGDYDWAHLAMQYWPERVRAKCKNDKSLAIAHGLEELYVEPVAATKKNTKK